MTAAAMVSTSSSINDAPDCPICGDRPTILLPYQNPTREHSQFDNRNIAVCGSCGFGNTFPRILGSDLGTYYAQSFAPAYSARVKRGDWPFFDERSLAQISLARLFADFQPGDAFLDLGPGVGISFFSATQLLPNPRLFGVEMNEETIALLGKNLPEVTIRSTVSDIAKELGGTPLKIAMTSHCLEHFNGDELLDAVHDIYSLMAPGGVLMIEVPHWDMRRWTRRVNDVPHLGFFSVRAIRVLAERAGFEVVLARAFGIPHGSNKFFEVNRRKDFNKNVVKGPGLNTLMLANSPDNLPRNDGKLVRAIAIKRS